MKVSRRLVDKNNNPFAVSEYEYSLQASGFELQTSCVTLATLTIFGFTKALVSNWI